MDNHRMDYKRLQFCFKNAVPTEAECAAYFRQLEEYAQELEKRPSSKETEEMLGYIYKRMQYAEYMITLSEGVKGSISDALINKDF